MVLPESKILNQKQQLQIHVNWELPEVEKALNVNDRQKLIQQQHEKTIPYLIFEKFEKLNVNEELKNKNISNIEKYKSKIIRYYQTALRNNNNTKNKDLEGIFQNIINKIDEFKLKKIYFILKSKEVLNNKRTKKLFEQLQKEYELLSKRININDMREYNIIKQFINNSKLSTRINATIEYNNNTLSQLHNNQPITNPTVNPGLKKTAMNSLRSLFSSKSQNYTRLSNDNQKKTLSNRLKSGISALRKTGENIGSFLKGKLKKATSQNSTSSAKAMKHHRFLNNINLQENSHNFSKQYQNPNGYAQLP